MSESTLPQQWETTQAQLRQSLVTTDDIDWSLETGEPVRSTPSEWVFSMAVLQNALKLVGGVDISFLDSSNTAVACLAVLTYPDLEVVYEDCQQVQLTVPYIAGFLAFREAAPFMSLVNRVAGTDFKPQVILVDGNGLLHPRRFGSACHLGILSGYPTIGVAKSLYCVEGLNEHTIKERVRNRMDTLELEKTDREHFELKGRHGEVLGAALYNHGLHHTRNPVYISTGHRVSLHTGLLLVERCSVHRIPEPIRQADLRSRHYVTRWLTPPTDIRC